MFHSKIQQSIHVSHLEFTLSNSTNARDGQAGRTSFFVNNFIEFRNIPIRERPDGEMAIDLSVAGNGSGGGITSSLLRDDIRQEIERQVLEQLTEVVP